MTTKSLFFYARFFVCLMLAGGVSVIATPNEAQAAAPTLVSVSLDPPPAGQSGKSRYHKVRQECPGAGRRNHPTNWQCDLTDPKGLVHDHGWSLPTGPRPVRLDNSPTAAYYKVGDTVRFNVEFSEPVTVSARPPLVYLQGDAFKVPYFTYSSGSGSKVLTFEKTVEEGQHSFGGLQLFSGFWPNTHQVANDQADLWRKGTALSAGQVRWIRNAANENFDMDTNGQTALTAFFATQADSAATGIIQYLVDPIPATVWIPGLIDNDDTAVDGDPATHMEDRRLEFISAVTRGDYVKEDFTETITEGTLQTGPFDVEFRFFNLDTPNPLKYPGTEVLADEVGTSFEPSDVEIMYPGVSRSDWGVELAYVGLDHRAGNEWPWSSGATHGPGEVKKSASFLVYKATITPPDGIGGDVAISLPQGATMDIAGNPSKASNTLIVPVRTRPGVQLARPAGETSVAIDDFTVELSFTHNVDFPLDIEKLSITQADGTALDWPVALADRTALGTTDSIVVTPAANFEGEVHITLAAGAVQDESEQWNVAAAAALVVTVDTPLRVVEPPEIVEPPAGVYTAGDKIEVSVTYAQENLRYEGANPPYLVVYLGEQVLANARHAVWTAAAGTNPTKVTFAYTVAATDTVTDAVRAPSVEILVPEETTLLSGPLGAPDGQQVGTAAPAVASGAAPASVPELDPVEDTSGRELPPIVRETPVIPVVPFFPEAASPKAAASEVPRSPIVFNEFGNGSGDANDWLELRNVTGSAVSLKDWELSVVQDDKKEDTSLFVFADVSVPANGLLLLTNSDPTADGNVLAGGDDVATADVEHKGSPHQYLINAGLSLPDDGQFLLILRNAKEKLGMNEAFVDVAGGGGSDTDAFVREQTGDYDTYVWPLQVRQAPGGDTEGALSSGKVWQRAKADIVGYHKDAWAEAAFTGIGYDRTVSKSAATGGTPGYPNGAVKTGAATPKGSITISEVMFDSGGGTLPQWIELYNASKTEALNLNRWQLEFQNVDSEELVGRPIVALALQEKVIQPNQTLLIVAGPARASSSTVFPAERVYNLLALHQRNLRIKRAQDTFLSAEGFYLKLTDSNGNLVDEVGNTDGNRRTKDAPAWALPVSGEAGVRSSLIRRYDNGVALKGKERASWALSANLKKLAVSELHWGDAEDIGTPGYRAGGALPVELSSFSVMQNEAGAVVLTWTTESEVDNAGFNLRRSEKRDSGFTLLNAALIAGAGTTGERQTYTYTDTSAKPGVEYYYQIEEVAFDGRPATLATRMLRGPVSAANRMLTTFGALKQQVK